MKRMKRNMFSSWTLHFSPFEEMSMKLKGNSSRLREGQAFLPGSIRDATPALVIKTATSNPIESAFFILNQSMFV